jgi:uncharacterized protein (TIGR02444 family)
MKKFDSFWAYSLAVYGRSGVPSAAHALQDRLGADVNLLLLCCWAASRGLPLDLEACRTLSEPWQREVVSKLRAARRTMRDVPIHAGAARREVEQARRQVGVLELEAERIEQGMLAAAVRGAGDGAPASVSEAAAAAANNLVEYLAMLTGLPAEQNMDDLAALLVGAFPQFGERAAREYVRQAVGRGGIGRRNVSH